MVNHFTEIDRFAGYLEKRTRGGKIAFTREMNRLEPKEQKHIKDQLSARGYEIPVPLEKPTPLVTWDDSDLDLLAKRVWALRSEEPLLTIQELVKNAQQILPPEKRKAKAKKLEPIAVRLRAIDAELSSRSPVKAPTRTEVVSTLTDDELLQHYDRFLPLVTPADMLDRLPVEVRLEDAPLPMVITHVLNVVGDRLGALMQGQENTLQDLRRSVGGVQNPAANTSARSTPAKPAIRIGILGLLSDQQSHVAKRFEGLVAFHFVDKNRLGSANLASNDVVILMTSFIAHSTTAAIKRGLPPRVKLVLHNGGLSTLGMVIEKLLSEERRT